MIEIPISELRLGDVRSRAIVSIDGQPVTGVLDTIGVTAYTTSFNPENNNADWHSLTLKVGEAEVKTGRLPGDFLIQVERDNDE